MGPTTTTADNVGHHNRHLFHPSMTKVVLALRRDMSVTTAMVPLCPHTLPGPSLRVSSNRVTGP